MAAEPVPPVTDNERDAQTIRKGLGLPHALYGRDGSKVAHSLGTLSECPVCEADQALTRLVAALSAATTQRDEWMTPFDGSGIEWHESLPSPYTYQASDFSKLMAAVHEYECARDAGEQRAEALAAQLQQAREALSWALDSLELAFKRLDSVDEYSPEHYLIRQAGFDKARAALAAAAPATTLNEPEGET